MSEEQSIKQIPSINFAVSVISPMYNVEKYVSEFLDSLLAQTFQDFEVIVVDDCSTDNSVEVVKSYMPKFGGRLKLAKTETNSGGCGLPKDVGFPLAQGEYLTFVDPDDTILPTALEKYYAMAKKFDADVVHCEKWYLVPDEFYHDAEYRKNLKPDSWPAREKIFITEPTLLSNDPEERVLDFCRRSWLTWSSCLQFVRRDFILKNGIRFPNTYSEDLVFTMCELCCAKNYLVIPDVFLFYRIREGSLTRESFDIPKLIHKYATSLKNAINYIDEFSSHQELFAGRPDLKYTLFNFYAYVVMPRLNRIYDNVPYYTLDEFLRKEFEGDNALTAYLFNAMNAYRIQKKQSLISVIIPMYNAEKYIGECLDSVLYQTFQNFEVIVVDDCSTDNSVAIVKSYIPKFRGKLTLAKTKKNSGTPGEPSNLGFDLSRGEYVFLLDNDDTITPDALEKLYSVAKEFKADVVACEKYYRIPEEHWNDKEFRKNLAPTSYQQGGFVSKPTLVHFDVAKRVQDCFQRRFLWPLWTKLIRRDYLMENQIRFQDTLIQDMLTTCCLAYTAKRFVRVPYVINYYRVRKTSLYNQEREPLEQMKTYIRSLKVGFRYLDTFLNGIEFFQKNPELKYAAFKVYFFENWNMYVCRVYDQIPAHDCEEALRKEFGGDDDALLMLFLFDVLFKTEKETTEIEALPISPNFAPFLTARIDIQLMSKTGDFQILLSDKKASVRKPEWLQRDGVGYHIETYAGKLSIKAKATVNGKIQLLLRGIDVRDSKDKSKRIPYWIDYTKLIVNNTTIFDTITSAWHNVPYTHNTDVKAGEEIKIQIEWQPHRSDT